jgi:predicted transcriptional regulator
VTDAELLVLQALWDQGPATIRQVVERQAAAGQTSQYATVQKLLERLEAKGCVRRRRGAEAITFEAALDRDGLIDRRLRALAEQLCGGRLTPLVTRLVRALRLTAQDRQALRALIEELERDDRSKKGRS